MTERCTPSPAWYRALTLTERRKPAPDSPPLNTTAAADDLGRGGRRLERWRSQPAFGDAALWQQRLAANGLTEPDLERLLDEPDAALAERIAAADWPARLERAFADGIMAPVDDGAADEVDALDAIRPLIDEGWARVRCAVERLRDGSTDLPFDAGGVEALLAAWLTDDLLGLFGRTLTLELNIARLQGLLEGGTPEERFTSFLLCLRRPEIARALLLEYPVLARDLARRVDQWAAYAVELLDHLCADWDAIRAAFSPNATPGMLVELEVGAGDRHRDGRTVALLQFSSGLRLVYKPRSLAADVHFQDLLIWLNERGARPPFRTLRVVDRGTYGWVEYAGTEDCATRAEVKRFYERQGAYLALLYALHGTDIHFENIIAAGEHPFVIDVESLFQPRRRDDPPADAEQQAVRDAIDSVLGIGLLPQRAWADTGTAGIDVSGLAAAAGQLIPGHVATIDRSGTDEMRFTRTRETLPEGHHRPALAGDTVDPLDYAKAIVAGFTRTYRLLMARRQELIADDGPLARFAGDEIRVILRHSRGYGLLLLDATHPDLLRDGLDRDRFFDQLWGEVGRRPYLRHVIGAERADLERGDIPIFTTRAGSRDLWTSTGVRIGGFFDEASGLEMARRRLARLSDDDLRQQRSLIETSLATAAMGEEQGRWPAYQLTRRQERAEPARLLAAARRIGDRLERTATSGDGDATWIGLTSVGEGYMALTTLGPDLYDGLSGVALFLAQLGAVTGAQRYTALARAATITLRRQIQPDRTSTRLVGGFIGQGGIIYTLAHLGTLWRQPDLLVEAETLVTRLPPLIDQDEHLDLIAGAAGCIGGLLALHRCAGSARALAAARQCGERLLERAEPMERGIGWRIPRTTRHALTGFSHGAAGIAWALLELAAATGEQRFRRAALDAIVYERSRFSSEMRNWPDLRESGPRALTAEAEPEYVTFWCNGAPGIGLARLLSLEHLDDAETRAEIESALQTTRCEGFGLNHSLCHGDLGNLELLYYAARTLGDARWQVEAEQLTAAILSSIEHGGPRCGLPLGVESPGLMTGLAGIGHGLLRAAAPDAVPSVLALAPPGPQGDSTEMQQAAGLSRR